MLPQATATFAPVGCGSGSSIRGLFDLRPPPNDPLAEAQSREIIYNALNMALEISSHCDELLRINDTEEEKAVAVKSTTLHPAMQ
jgi:hypothetical protein